MSEIEPAIEPAALRGADPASPSAGTAPVLALEHVVKDFPIGGGIFRRATKVFACRSPRTV